MSRRKNILTFLFLGALALLLSTSTNGQTLTQVSATITDPNGLPYSNATVQIQLVGGGSTPQTTPCAASPCYVQNPGAILTDAGGKFTIALYANASIAPSGTTWQFLVLEPGVAPPWGYGPKSFIVSLTISGATDNISSSLSAAAPALTPAFSGGGGGPPTGPAGGDLNGTYPDPDVTNLSHVTNSSLANSGLVDPSTTVSGQTCTLGGNCTISCAGVTNCAGATANTIAISPNCGSQALCQQSPWNTQVAQTLSIASGSHAVSSSAPIFTAGDVGKNIVGFTTCDTGITASTDVPILPETTIATFVDSEHITTTGAASGTQAATACGYWGNSDDMAASAADTLSSTYVTDCPTIVLPAGYGWFDQGHFNVTVPGCQNGAAGFGQPVGAWGQHINGQGKGVTVVFVAPGLVSNLSTCTGGGGANDCYGGQLGQEFSDFEMTGGDNVASGFASAKNLFELASYGTLRDMLFDNFGGSDTHATFQLTANGTNTLIDTSIVGFGSIVKTGTAGIYIFSSGSAIQAMCTAGAELEIQAGATVLSSGSIFAPSVCALTNNRAIDNFGTLVSHGDFWFNESATHRTFALVGEATGKAWVYGGQIYAGNGANGVCVDDAVSGTYTFLSGTRCSPGSADASIFGVAGATIIDAGGNTGFNSGTGVPAGTPIAGQFPVTVSNSGSFPVLPPCNAANAGLPANVTDATATTFNSTVAGGGANPMGVRCNGTNWVIY